MAEKIIDLELVGDWKALKKKKQKQFFCIEQNVKTESVSIETDFISECDEKYFF